MNLIASTSTFGFFTLISRILGYVRDILIAIFLGTSLLADVFFVAFRLHNTFRRLFAEGTFNAAFIPSYAGELTEGKEKGYELSEKLDDLYLYCIKKCARAKKLNDVDALVHVQAIVAEVASAWAHLPMIKEVA